MEKQKEGTHNIDNIGIHEGREGKTTTESGGIIKSILSSSNQKKSIDKALFNAAAPVATAAILLPSMNNAQIRSVVTDENPGQSDVSIICTGDSSEKKKNVVMQEKICSTPSSSKLKLLEKKQSESFIATPDSLVGNLRSKMLRRKSQVEEKL